jgi:hypothetical protein
MDLNKLRDQLKSSRPVQVTREGRLRLPDERDDEPARREASEPSRVKDHVFAAPWHLTDPTRYQTELDLMRRYTRAAHAIADGKVTFEEVVDTDFDLPFRFRITIPDQFPLDAPKVVCLSPAVPHEVRYHVYRNGTLCLCQPGQWQPEMHVLDVRNWACEWAFNVIPKVLAGVDWMSAEHRS